MTALYGCRRTGSLRGIKRQTQCIDLSSLPKIKTPMRVVAADWFTFSDDLFRQCSSKTLALCVVAP